MREQTRKPGEQICTMDGLASLPTPDLHRNSLISTEILYLKTEIHTNQRDINPTLSEGAETLRQSPGSSRGFLPLPGPFGRGEGFSPSHLHSLLPCFPHPQVMWLPCTQASAAAICFPLLLLEGMVKSIKSGGSRSQQKFRPGKRTVPGWEKENGLVFSPVT